MSTGFHPKAGPVPLHVGIIPDGGRRWAKANRCTLGESYQRTVSLLQLFAGILCSNGVNEISIYLSSIQNFRRKKAELETYLSTLDQALYRQVAETALFHQLRVVIPGRLEIVPEPTLQAIRTLEQQTAGFAKGRLNLLVGYDPHEEILQAFNKSTGPGSFLSGLWITTPLDLVIRSGGAHLLSNFLPLQSAWARLYFPDKLFNDLTGDDILQILQDFEKIERKFGT